MTPVRIQQLTKTHMHTYACTCTLVQTMYTHRHTQMPAHTMLHARTHLHEHAHKRSYACMQCSNYKFVDRSIGLHVVLQVDVYLKNSIKIDLLVLVRLVYPYPYPLDVDFSTSLMIHMCIMVWRKVDLFPIFIFIIREIF